MPRIKQEKGHPADAFRAAGLLGLPRDAPCLDTLELSRLEQSFRDWRRAARRSDVAASRQKVLLIFLLIRHAGARLGEALGLDLGRDLQGNLLVLGKGSKNAEGREVPLAQALAGELSAARARDAGGLGLDPGHVRRKFYERAADCGFAPELASPNAIRRARAVELLREGVPLPLVQRLLGQSSPNLAASYVEMTEEDAREAARHFLARESRRFTSARNTFFGKVTAMKQGDIQAAVTLSTPAGFEISTIITNTSLTKLGLRKGAFCTAEVKAPWVLITPGSTPPVTSAENILPGRVFRISEGKLTTEIILALADGTELCSITGAQSAARLALAPGSPAFACFGAFHVVLERMM